MKNVHPHTSYLPGINPEQVEYERQQLLAAAMQDRVNNPGHVSAIEKQLVQLQLCRCSSSEEIISMIPDIYVALKIEGLPISIEEIEVMANAYISSRYSSQNDSSTSLTASYFIIMLMITLIFVLFVANR